MRKHRIRRPSPALVVACIALLVALGGTGYATVVNVPRNSVGTLQLQRNAVKAAKIAPNAVRTGHILNGSLLVEDFKAGQIPQGPKGDKGDKGDKGAPGATNVTQRTGTPVTVSAGSAAFASASCQSGERATGGGAFSNRNDAWLSASRPTGTPPTGWQVVLRSPVANAQLIAYVVCAAP
jgi:hypothetical protein